ncbi:MAG: hypothetical protein ACFB2X_03305 [Rivularia sp. (in: cyanobacteria)]
MFKKSLAFGLLAAGLMVEPGAALADSQSQDSGQSSFKQSNAIDGREDANSSESLNVREQIQKRREKVGGHRGGGYRRGYGRRYSRTAKCARGYNGQSQNSSQGTVQSGAAIAYSDNAQSNSSVNDQKQTSATSRVCR